MFRVSIVFGSKGDGGRWARLTLLRQVLCVNSGSRRLSCAGCRLGHQERQAPRLRPINRLINRQRVLHSSMSRTGDLVVVATGENPNLVRQHLINQPMLLVNSPRPAAGQRVPQRFRLTDAGKRIAQRFSDETDDANRLSPILFCPPCQVVERPRVELDASHKPSFATASSSGTPLPRSSAASSRCRMVSDFNRYAVSRSEAISLQSAIGTITAVGSPASLETTWMSASGTRPF